MPAEGFPFALLCLSAAHVPAELLMHNLRRLQEPIHMRFIQRNGPADSAPDLSDRVQTDASTPVELTVT